MKDFETGLTVERLRALLSYDPASGIFCVREARGKLKAGDVAGTVQPHGYVIIRIDYYLYRAHRLAWLYVTGDWPCRQIDHKDGNKHNNRRSNLRQATVTENLGNQKLSLVNTSGFKGVTWHKGRRKWQAGIQVDGRHLHLGLFTEKETAHAAYLKAAQQHFGEFARAV